MNIIEKFNLVNKKKLGLSFSFLVVSILIIGLLIFSMFDDRLNDVIKTEAETTLETVSSQNILNLRNNLLTKQQFLTMLAQSIEKTNNYSIENIMSILKIINSANDFYTMGIIDENGIVHTTLNENLDLSDYDYYINGMNGINGISHAYISQNKKLELNVFTVPIYMDNQVKMILSATYKSEDFSKLVNIPFFHGKGKSLVIDAEGNLVSEVHQSHDENTSKTPDKIDHISFILDEILDDETENLISYNYGGTEYLSYAEKVGINDWCLISYVPKEYVYKNLDIINHIILSKILLISVGIIIISLLFFKEYNNYQKKIAKIVFYDELTQEKNYEYLKLNFKYMSKKYKIGNFLMAMDIDKFKNINIMHGSQTADELLKYIPTIFKELLPEDTLFKCEGDTFVCILRGKSQQQILDKISKLQVRVKKDMEEKLIVPINLSFGLCSLDEFKDLHSIYTNALIAKNEIKGNVNHKVNFFNEENKTQIIENRAIESKFIDSLKNKEFEVWYQPKHHVKTNEFYGAEALIRWREKDGQLISPAKFIPVFENSGQILELDEAIIEMIFKDINEMGSLGFEIKPISINLSRVHVEHFGIVDKIQELLDKYKINPSYVSFEITESALIDNSKAINQIISELHHMGFEVDIDDYGTGNSTLNSLYSSDFDTLKLDKSFIANIGNKKTDIILKSTISMAKDLNMIIVAEGVETQEQLTFLRENNCSLAQGYYFSKPLDKQKYFGYLKQMGLKK